MTIDLGNGRRLVLADLGAWGWLGGLAALAALGLILALYRHERRLVSRPVGLLLLSLRLLAAGALMVALLDPIAARSFRESVRGRLVVGLDRSESMESADPQRPEVDQGALARALELSPAEEVGAMARAEIVRRWLAGPPNIANALEADHEVEAFGFAGETVPGALADWLQGGAEADASLRRGATDWAPVLEAALRADDDAAPVVGVVLFSDGRRNAPPQPGDALDRLAERGVPVYPVLIGSTVPPRDVAIAALRGPEQVFLGDEATVTAEIKADGLAPGTPISVHLERPGAEPMTTTVAAPAAGQARPTARFRVAFDAAGAQPMTVSVETPGEPDLRPDNNRRDRPVQVVDDKARVLLVDAEARWEFRYLRNAMARDDRVEVEAVVLEPPPAPSSATPTYLSAIPEPPEPGSGETDPLNGFDVIVMGDLEPSQVPETLWERLEAFVAERGGTLVVSSGPRGGPGAWDADDRARALLPIVSPRLAESSAADAGAPASPLPHGVRLRPVASMGAEADAWPMLQFASEAEASLAVWDQLPPMPWAVVGRVKPGASALVAPADAPDPASAAIIAAQPYGLGKVLWVGTDSTWRWRLRVGDLYHHRFWGQVVRWAASGQLASGNRLVRFGPDRPRVPEGETLTLQARFSDQAPGIVASTLAAARIERAEDESGEAVALVPLRPMADRDRVFEGAAPNLPPGAYVARLEVPELADTFEAEGLEAPSVPFEVIERETTERIELAADLEPMARLADRTGGRLLRETEVKELPRLLAARVMDRTRVDETPLWDTPWGLALFFGLLTLEWTVRKRAGLP